MLDQLQPTNSLPASVLLGRRTIGTSVRNRSRGWLPLVCLPGSVFALYPAVWPRWGFMWALAISIYTGFKWLTWRRTPTAAAPIWKHAGYLLAWPGMNAAEFFSLPPSEKHVRCPLAEWCFALAKLTAGTLLFWGVARLVPDDDSLIAGWIGMVGIVMMLHFGVFHLLSCGWRTIGVDARPLMNWPLASRSISEFWGVRWNTAFRDLTHRFLFRPLTPHLGARGAVLVGFVASGLIHEFVVSLPAGGGYGGPTLFFLVQGCAILVSRSAIGKRIGLRTGFGGWAFAMLGLLPAFLLFQPVFVREVVTSFMRFVGAMP